MSGRISAPTEKALKLISKGSTPYAAAKKVGIALSTVYRAQKRLKRDGPAPGTPPHQAR
jgi:transposase